MFVLLHNVTKLCMIHQMMYPLTAQNIDEWVLLSVQFDNVVLQTGCNIFRVVCI